MSVLRERRSLLKAALGLVTGAAVPASPRSIPWAHAGVGPWHDQARLLEIDAIEVVRLDMTSADESPPAGGIVLRLERYESRDGQPIMIRRLVLPEIDIRAGLYLRSAVPYRTRVRLVPSRAATVSSFVLDRPSLVAVFQENCQVLVSIGAGPA